MSKQISILGSTGSIGKQALEVVDSLPDHFKIYGLAAGANIEILIEQIKKYKPEVVSVKDETTATLLSKEISGIEILYGNEGLIEIAGSGENNLVLVAVTGITGLFPTLAAINNKIDIALANKETLVAAGNIVMERATRNSVSIIPVDSEHSAIHQCLNYQSPELINKLIITASGGPFRTKSIEEIQKATVEETLTHPKWSMGDKISVDSATLMNKGLEVIEAHWLFGTDYENIEVVIHPQSIIHSAVEFNDGSVIAQMGVPSMHIPIQYALTFPDRYRGLKTNSLSLTEIAKLDFELPDLNKFPCLRLAYEAGKKGDTYPVVLNAANEEAVYEFLNKKISLTDIAKTVEKCLESHNSIKNPNLDDIIQVDDWARKFSQEILQAISL